MTVRTAFGLSRLVVALACAIALISRFLWGLGTATFTASNFFAYLTIQSNLVYVVVAAMSGVGALRGMVDAPWLTTLRAVVLSCTVSAGIVFAVLMQQAGQRGFPIYVPWSDLALHFWLPALALVDWIAAPGRRSSLWRAIPYVLGYLFVWGAVTLARGAIVKWYPYFFLDPAQVNSFAEFGLFCGLAIALFAMVSLGMVALSRLVPLAERKREPGQERRRLPRR